MGLIDNAFCVSCVAAIKRELGTDGSWRVGLIDLGLRASRRFSRDLERMGRGGGAPAPNDDDGDEKHGIPDNPPQQRTQGKNTPFGNPLIPILGKDFGVLGQAFNVFC